ncbi:MAG: thiolase family protein [Alcaligenaceae bacterium]|nr:thiolase family protein [Alcaligenaceae bacterium]
MSNINSNEVVIIEAVRTAFGRRGGALREIRPDAMLATALEAVINRSAIDPAMVGDVLAGCVSQAGEQGGNIARQALLIAGFPETVPGVTMNRMCGSSQYATHAAAQAVGMGDMDFAIACGVESMSRVPMFLDLTLGQHDFTGFDNLHPDLLKRFDIPHQVESAELIADHWSLSRTALDDYSVESHRRAKVARDAGYHSEIVPLQGVDKEGNTITLDYDEGIRDSIDRARMDAMAPVFRTAETGKVTAANASQMSDGASAILVGRYESAIELGITPKAKFLARVVVGSDPIMQLTGIIPATHQALAKTGLTIKDLDWIEVNEAFASVALSFEREFKPDAQIFNPWGGAIAHGHPLGGTGAGLMAKMLSGLRQVDGELGLQVMCIGHGMATATIVQRLS